jgi:hypothetical protein
MKKLVFLFAIIFLGSHAAQSQGHDIRITLKGMKDTAVYLVKYTWDQKYVVDTCRNIKNSTAVFKGKDELEKGMYMLVSQATVVYFEFFVNDFQKFTVTGDAAEPTANLSVTGSKDNELFFAYLKYVASKNKEFGKTVEKTKGMSKADSTKFMNEKVREFMAGAKKYDQEFMQRAKGTFVYDFMNLKTEKEPTEIPKASNGRPDSLYSYYYYKSHYFDGVDFKDERIMRTPLFEGRI